MKKKRKIVIGYQTKCQLCGEKIQGTSKEQCQERLVEHIDNKCKSASFMRGLEEQGIYKETIQIMRGESLARKLKKLSKTYSIKEIQRELEMLEDLD